MIEPTQAELEAAHCWERDDVVPHRPATTAFRRAARLAQARWRDREGHPIGTQPIRPKPGAASRPVGSRLPLAYAIETGANFVTPAALDAVRARLAIVERHQSIDQQRLWADLLWSSALTFNLFGDLRTDVAAADEVVAAWFPDRPGPVVEVRFLHSPGRLDPAYLDSLRDFAVAFVLDAGRGRRGVVAVDVRFAEWNKPEQPKPERMWRYGAVAAASGVFVPGAIDHLAGTTPHCEMWLEHLLLLSMLQHESGQWAWGRSVVVHHPGNPDRTELLTGYRDFLVDDETFHTVRLDDLLDAGALPANATRRVRQRYLFDEP